jgi:hypothetical protein
VEQEFLKRFEHSILSYRKGVEVAERYLGVKHPICSTLKTSLIAAKKSLVAITEKTTKSKRLVLPTIKTASRNLTKSNKPSSTQRKGVEDFDDIDQRVMTLKEEVLAAHTIQQEEEDGRLTEEGKDTDESAVYERDESAVAINKDEEYIYDGAKAEREEAMAAANTVDDRDFDEDL